jgi:hypothetical protein
MCVSHAHAVFDLPDGSRQRCARTGAGVVRSWCASMTRAIRSERRSPAAQHRLPRGAPPRRPTPTIILASGHTRTVRPVSRGEQPPPDPAFPLFSPWYVPRVPPARRTTPNAGPRGPGWALGAPEAHRGENGRQRVRADPAGAEIWRHPYAEGMAWMTDNTTTVEALTAEVRALLVGPPTWTGHR